MIEICVYYPKSKQERTHFFSDRWIALKFLYAITKKGNHITLISCDDYDDYYYLSRRFTLK